MKHRLPPMKALIAAESVYHLGSFKMAADSLHLTPSAISHQVRSLENWLGFRLFDRDTRSLALTDSGRRYLSKVSVLFSQLDTDTRMEIESLAKVQTIRLQTTDSFANRWLVEELHNYKPENPNIHVNIVTFEYTESFKPVEADMAILYTRDECPNKNRQLLFSESIFPVCSPKLIAQKNHVNPISLLSQNLIQDSNLGVSWQQWCAYANAEIGEVDLKSIPNGPIFNHSHLAIRSAELGNGFTLASEPLVSSSIQKGTLIAPFKTKMPTDFGYYIINSPDPDIQNKCRHILDWLLLYRCSCL